MDTNTKRLCMCSIECADCYFSKYNYPHNQGDCTKNFAHWVNSEYKELKQFTEREKAFIKLFPEIKYLARDRNGSLYAYTDKPQKDKSMWNYSGCNNPAATLIPIFLWGVEFNAIQWDDEEPMHRSEILGE